MYPIRAYLDRPLSSLPELRARDYARVLQHPSEEDMALFVRGGERAAWPHVEAIRASTAAELALTEAAAALRARARDIDERLRLEKAKAAGAENERDDSFVTQSDDSPSDREQGDRGEDDAHLGAGLSCAVESAAWH